MPYKFVWYYMSKTVKPEINRKEEFLEFLRTIRETPDSTMSKVKAAKGIHLGENIKKLRKQRGWSQSELAEKASITLTHVNRLETGKYNPSIDVVLRLARALDVTLDQLVLDNLADVSVHIENKNLAERIRLIETLTENRREALFQVLDDMLTNQKMRQFLDQQAG